ncbi:MAG: hypothetical protein BGO09_05920 [Bacteroidetes bacterium 47-18]|nr:MAG: hypothetical protein BGO09_05920 [Bacteroidetes bacterium 47-18]
MSEIIFEAGNDITLNIPKERYEATLRFYRDILLLDVEEKAADQPSARLAAKVQFGNSTLWLYCTGTTAQPATWLELCTNDMTAALNYLHTNGIISEDAQETVPEGMRLVRDPAGNTLLLKARE